MWNPRALTGWDPGFFGWLDQRRPEPITSALNDSRNVIVQTWYPTEVNAIGPHMGYLDGLGSLPKKIGPWPGWASSHYDQVNTHSIIDAPISKLRAKWPVIIFLTGNGASRAFYTSLVTGLASRGCVVLAIDHPYEAMVAKLARGKIVTTIERHLAGQPNLLKFMGAAPTPGLPMYGSYW